MIAITILVRINAVTEPQKSTHISVTKEALPGVNICIVSSIHAQNRHTNRICGVFFSGKFPYE